MVRHRVGHGPVIVGWAWRRFLSGAGRRAQPKTWVGSLRALMESPGRTFVTLGSMRTEMCLHLHEVGQPGGRTLMYLHLLTGAGRCWPDPRIQLSPTQPELGEGTAGRQDAPVLTSTPAMPSVAHVLVGQVITVLEKRRVPGEALLMGHGIAAAMAAVVSAVRPDLVCAAVL